MAKIKFSYKLTGKGWSETIISDGVNEASLTASYISDPVDCLIRALVGLMQLADSARCSWAEEPGEYCWILDKSQDNLQIKILWFDYFSASRYRADEKGKLIFSTECKLLDFTIQVRGQLRQLLNEVGIEGYKGQWGRDFPISDFQKLDELISKTKSEGESWDDRSKRPARNRFRGVAPDRGRGWACDRGNAVRRGGGG